eukprot:4158117-Amphidinium_carterae.1
MSTSKRQHGSILLGWAKCLGTWASRQRHTQAFYHAWSGCIHASILDVVTFVATAVRPAHDSMSVHLSHEGIGGKGTL